MVQACERNSDEWLALCQISLTGRPSQAEDGQSGIGWRGVPILRWPRLQSGTRRPNDRIHTDSNKKLAPARCLSQLEMQGKNYYCIDDQSRVSTRWKDPSRLTSTWREPCRGNVSMTWGYRSKNNQMAEIGLWLKASAERGLLHRKEHQATHEKVMFRPFFRSKHYD